MRIYARTQKIVEERNGVLCKGRNERQMEL